MKPQTAEEIRYRLSVIEARRFLDESGRIEYAEVRVYPCPAICLQYWPAPHIQFLVIPGWFDTRVGGPYCPWPFEWPEEHSEK